MVRFRSRRRRPNGIFSSHMRLVRHDRFAPTPDIMNGCQNSNTRFQINARDEGTEQLRISSAFPGAI